MAPISESGKRASGGRTSVTRRSWGSRLRGAFTGVIVGLVLVGVASWILFVNEGRAVRRAKALSEGARAVVTITPERADPAKEAALVHTTGATTTGETLTDPLFGIRQPAVHLERRVEMFQWIESTSSSTEKKTGGSTETTRTTTYRTDWSERWIDSSAFEQPAGHANPAGMPFETREVSAQNVSLGAFRLTPSQIGRMRAWVDLPARSTADVAPSIAGRVRVHEDGFYVGADPDRPAVGDLRVAFRHVPATTVSLVAMQAGQSFAPYPIRSGGTVDLLRVGTASAEQMFEAAHGANRFLTWALRLLGFVVMLIGFRIVLKPLSVLADVLPALGNLVEKGAGGVAFLVAAPVSLAIIALAWLFYRPLLAVTILGVAGLGIVLLARKLTRARRQAKTVPPPPPPVPSAT